MLGLQNTQPESATVLLSTTAFAVILRRFISNQWFSTVCNVEKVHPYTIRNVISTEKMIRTALAKSFLSSIIILLFSSFRLS